MAEEQVTTDVYDTPSDIVEELPTGVHDDKGYSEEKCVRCGWVMGHAPLNCNNDDTPHIFPSQMRQHLTYDQQIEKVAKRLYETLMQKMFLFNQKSHAEVVVPWESTPAGYQRMMIFVVRTLVSEGAVRLP